jgi:hypothetical protein
MVARAATAGLSTADLEVIREALASGRRQRVQFTDSAGQVAGQLGHVVGLTDPEVSDEWVVVRFGRDELPFAPADLTLPRTAGKRSAAAPALKLVESPVTAALPSPRSGRGAEPAPPKPNLKSVPSTVEPAPRPVATPQTAPAAPAAVKPVKVAKPKPPTTLTVTVSYVDGDWSVTAQQGSKVLAKPYLIKASEALKMVALLDVAGVQEAVEHLIAAERVQTEQKVRRLRDELAEVEARLAELGLSH